MRNISSETSLQRLACPICGEHLVRSSEEKLNCTGCGIPFSYDNGVPNLMTRQEERSKFALTEYAEQRHWGTPSFRKTRIFRLLRRLYHAWLRVEIALQVVTPLDPLFHLRKFQERIESLLPNEMRVILDVGGGRAPYRHVISHPGDEYWIMDVDRSVLPEEANTFCLIGDTHNLPFQPGQFDIILMTEVLEHLYEPKEAMRCCAKALRPGGLLILTTPQYWHIHGWPSDYFRYTNYGLGYLCEVNGLSVVEFSAMGGPCQLLYSMLVLNFIGFVRWHGIIIVLNNLLLLFSWLTDAIFFTAFTTGSQKLIQDTRGWALLAVKKE